MYPDHSFEITLIFTKDELAEVMDAYTYGKHDHEQIADYLRRSFVEAAKLSKTLRGSTVKCF
jgi:hypothetical protein